ncbi:uncharacterized protein FTOL_02539 [Fusarium torulosum]|uniref:Uncharacterized protein n=1 Tax=Fusarium torulosum TaxID=33205 RepID=A0AAE8SED9_9HYPO|nr:uncharacterized protein FTOL_02539 [Fusarium torulosum]
MEKLNIWMVISVRYRVFDQSGKLPFSIVFGLCRRSPDDTDPRSLRLSARQTILDVPYALSNNLLQLRKYSATTKTDIQVDVGQLGLSNSEESYLTLPSPVGRTENWRTCLSEYYYHIDPESELASLLEPGEKYSIKNFTGWQLGADKYAYIDEQGELSSPSKKQKLVSSRVHGRPTFHVVESLPWPPELQTRMHKDKDTNGNSMLVDVTVLNMGSKAITVQTHGRQRFLTPHGALQQDEEFPINDGRPRIIDPDRPSPDATIQILDVCTNKVIRGAKKRSGYVQYHQKDLRPTLDLLTTLRPGEPLIRHIDVGNLLSNLPDGEYGLRMEPRGMWWCIGDCKEWDEDRVPHDLFSTLIPPLMLKCDDVVRVQVENGDVLQ